MLMNSELTYSCGVIWQRKITGLLKNQLRRALAFGENLDAQYRHFSLYAWWKESLLAYFLHVDPCRASCSNI